MTQEITTTVAVKFWILYVADEPRAILIADTAENAIAGFRQQMLGVKDAPDPTLLTVKPGLSAPIDDVIRLGIFGLYMRMFQADLMAQSLTGGGRPH